MNTNLQTATLAGGCFWCLEAVFDEMKGVTSVESGYSNGHISNPTYREVCGGDTIAAVAGFADRVRSDPAAYGTPAGARGEPILAQLISERERLLAAPRYQFSYRRSDGSAHPLTLAEHLGRPPALEVAYNPNDCPEQRWGAPAGSDEASTCTRRAPPDQQQQMASHRAWFRDPAPP